MDEERQQVIRTARSALASSNHDTVPLLVGTGGGSALHTIRLSSQAKEAGADYSIVICPGYFAFAMSKNRGAIKDFFMEVLDKSVLPVMIYNFPGAASGIDLDSDLLIELSDHPNCFGAKVSAWQKPPRLPPSPHADMSTPSTPKVDLRERRERIQTRRPYSVQGISGETRAFPSLAWLQRYPIPLYGFRDDRVYHRYW
jgi:dihydrodipicolinate synthase/N-acetylneuraminate lyase